MEFSSFLYAFLFGGMLCVIAQLLLDLTRLSPAIILVIYVSAGVLLGALGLYMPLRDLCGCGISVPLVGFGGAIAEGVRKAVSEDGLFGALSGGFTAAAGGTSAALIFGYIAALLFRGKPKNL